MARLGAPDLMLWMISSGPSLSAFLASERFVYMYMNSFVVVVILSYYLVTHTIRWHSVPRVHSSRRASYGCPPSCESAPPSADVARPRFKSCAFLPRHEAMYPRLAESIIGIE
jgi:hypothetical protein